MKTAGIDIGTTTISGVVLEKGENGQAKILETAREHHAEFIALSALMTTTMQRMREIVAAAKQEGITAKIIIGGAVITQEYADEIGADGYSKDAADAVKLAKSLME